MTTMEALIKLDSVADFKEILHLSQSALIILLIIILAWILLRLSAKAIRLLKVYSIDHTNTTTEDLKRIETLGRVFHYVSSVVIYVVAGMVILSEMGVSIAPILATAGVLGLAVGFAAQSLIKDYFNGIFLLLENQVRQGDVVEAGGKAGLVEEVTLRYIKMRDYDGNVHFIPNSVITTVTNMSREFAYAVINVGVAYRENTDEVMELMLQTGAILRKDETFGPTILDDMEMAGVDQWGDSAVTIRCRFKVQPLGQWGVRREYLRRLKHVFDQHGIEIPFPHMTIYPGQNKDGTAPPLFINASVDSTKAQVD